ncbi:MAG: hypothetical protein CV081_03130 [Nitrospira sp. LK265]|nr:hypothetical protein [Nitrospira sp. LK265]
MAAGSSVPQWLSITTETYLQCPLAPGLIDEEEGKKACTLSADDRASALGDCRNRIRRVETSQPSCKAEGRDILSGTPVAAHHDWRRVRDHLYRAVSPTGRQIELIDRGLLLP